MEPTYVDQVQKLDIRKLMARLFKSARTNHYVFTMAMENWPPVEGKPDGNLLGVEIVLERAAIAPAAEPLAGNMLLKFTLPHGLEREQMLLLEGMPATKASWRWKTRCPFNGKQVQALYFMHSLQQFVSLKATGLKYRPQLSRESRRHLDRMWRILQELEAKNPEPFIPKPPWMTQARYDELILELDKANTRATSTLLDVRVEFPDEYEEPDPNAKLERLPPKDPQSLAMCYRDRDGKLQIKAKYQRKYGLPEGAAPDSLALVTFPKSLTK